jgi:hypothetical protein
MADRAIMVGCDASWFPTIDELHRSIIDASGGNLPAFTVIDAALMFEPANVSRTPGAIGTPAWTYAQAAIGSFPAHGGPCP